MPKPIPDFLAHLPLHSGLPIPFVTGRNGLTGKIDFRVTDVHNHTIAQRFQLCAICGKHIAAPPYVFVLGKQSREARMVYEPPMHPACAIAALTMCPFLSREGWDHGESRPGTLEAIPRDEIPPKPARIGLGFAPSYFAVRNPDNGMYYASLPAVDFPTQWWRYVDGVLTPGADPP